MSILPLFLNDPLLEYRPFPAVPSNYFLAHWHEAAASAAFYTIMQLLSGPVSSCLFGKAYTSLPRKTRINFDIHIVSMVQCVISIAILIPHWNNPGFVNRVTDPAQSISGYTPYGGMVAAITLGYFVWDVVVCIKYYSLFGLGFLLHGLAAFYVFGAALYPFCQPWALAFLLFELSTPFVNINWFASKLPAGTISDKVYVVNGLILLVVFFTVRILWGFYAVGMVATDIYYSWGNYPAIFPISVLGLNFMLDVLNLFWFYKMLRIAAKKAGGKKKDE